MIYAYIRVSTEKQNPDNQKEEIRTMLQQEIPARQICRKYGVCRDTHKFKVSSISRTLRLKERNELTLQGEEYHQSLLNAISTKRARV